MPVTVEKADGYRVSTPGGVKAKSTSAAKAKRQANLLRAVEHGWKPTGKPARNVKARRGLSRLARKKHG
ncbi:MAG: hypothetical protein JSW06_01870 [Thermoplasmatales archaeon]|nr:MAG: hypothetical protein JSW06_01870 [Thermoplasmatales archaeon]